MVCQMLSPAQEPALLSRCTTVAASWRVWVLGRLQAFKLQSNRVAPPLPRKHATCSQAHTCEPAAGVPRAPCWRARAGSRELLLPRWQSAAVVGPAAGASPLPPQAAAAAPAPCLASPGSRTACATLAEGQGAVKGGSFGCRPQAPAQCRRRAPESPPLHYHRHSRGPAAGLTALRYSFADAMQQHDGSAEPASSPRRSNCDSQAEVAGPIPYRTKRVPRVFRMR